MLTPFAFPPQGKPGVRGPKGDGPFGQITYTERVVEASDYFSAGVRQQILFEPTTVQDRLKPPFVGHTFWQNSVIVPREMDDLYGIVINLIVEAQEIGGQMLLEVDVGSALGPVGTAQYSLMKGARTMERVRFPEIPVQVQQGFLTNGARLFLTSTVPVLVSSETVFILPRSDF